MSFRDKILAIQKATGLKDYQIAQKLGIPPSTLGALKNNDHDPLFSTGMAILELHRQCCA